MNTIARVLELADERDLSLFRLSQLCSVPYSTLKTTEKRGGQLQVETIELICRGLNISMADQRSEEHTSELQSR